jgi:gluconolactonase
LIFPGVLFGCGSGSSPATATIPDASSADAAPRADGAAADGAAAFAPLKFADIGTPTKISDQFYFTEGPVWNPTKGVLYFTDINAPPPSGAADAAADAVSPIDGATLAEASAPDASAADGSPGGASPPDAAAQAVSTGGAIYQLTPPSTIALFLASSGNTDGLGLDPQGNLIGAGFASRNVWRLSASGTMQTLAPCAQGGGTCYMGSEINTPDDITARSDGTLYFTDPTFASGSQGFPVRSLPLANAQGVYRLTTDGVLHLEDSTTAGPNGVNFSPDEKTLYVSYTFAGAVYKFDVAADGSLSHKTMFATGATVADSMCVDGGGNVYVGTVSGLAVYDPTGKPLGTISVDGRIVTNCAFGGADQKTLFITARTQATLTGAPPLGGGLLYQIGDMPVPGMPGRN